MEKMKYNVGDSVWHPTWHTTENYVTCPDCGGTGRIRVIFHDDSQVSVECRNCGPGYNPPTGRIKVYDRKPDAQYVIITGMELTSEDGISKILYNCSNAWHVSQEDLFDNSEDASAAAIQKCLELDKKDRDKVLRKEKDTRTWAWNASYHRNCIKKAEKDIAYHTDKLNVASLKAKEDKKQ